MNIKELYKIYLEIKERKLDREETKWQFYQKLIFFKESEETSINILSIENALKFPGVQNEYEIRRGSEQLVIKERNEFISVQFMDNDYSEKSYIKFYFSVPDNIKEKFMIDYGNFVKENKIRGFYKIREKSKANDEVTVRVFDPKDYKKVFDFLKKYVNKDIKQHEFMPTIDGVGVTIDDGNSYNRFLQNELINFFEYAESIDDITNSKFLEYINSQEAADKMASRDKKSLIVYNINLLNAFDENLKLEDIINKIDNAKQSIINYPADEENMEYINTSIARLFLEIGKKGLEETIQGLKKFINEDYETFLSRQFYSHEVVQKTLEYHLSKRKDYNKKEGVFEYLKRQLYIFDNNLNNLCSLFENIYNTSGIKGIENLLNCFNEIFKNKNKEYNIQINDTYIPYCYNDELHPEERPFDCVNLETIYERIAKLHNIDTDEEEYWLEPKEGILKIYKERERNRKRG